jgi:signal transduction histidine kinase
MKHFSRALTRWIVLGAMAATFVTWLLGCTFFVIGLERARHSTLDAASVAVREAVGPADTAGVVKWMGTMNETFAAWNVEAAAFDRTGAFVGGDESLRADGLPVGREPPPPLARQIAIVPTHDGYILLVPSVRGVNRIRFGLAIGLLLMLLLVGGIAYAIATAWTREKTRSLARLYERLETIAAGGPAAPFPQEDNPLSRELSDATRAAIERLTSDLAVRAADEGRLREFLAEAGHELRTPLAIAVGYVGILKRGGIGDPVLAERIVGDISIEHDRLQRLVERILQLARLDAVPAEEGAVADAVRVTNEAVALVRPLDPDRTFEVDAPAVAYTAIAGDDLRDALRNLLENAIRYAPGGPISIAILGNGIVSIRITDTGPGMDAFTTEHAFDRFFRGADRGSVPGTGLGLAIVRRIVERAGGSVTLASVPGKGTVVELLLPKAHVSGG